MRRIRKTNTIPEMRVRKAAHALGFRFRLHRSDLPGTPDLVFPSMGKAIMVHGCFWHQHNGCKLARMPKSRLEYWAPKLARNQERDRQAVKKLKVLGLDVLIVWECQIGSVDMAKELIDSFLASGRTPKARSR